MQNPFHASYWTHSGQFWARNLGTATSHQQPHASTISPTRANPFKGWNFTSWKAAFSWILLICIRKLDRINILIFIQVLCYLPIHYLLFIYISYWDAGYSTKLQCKKLYKCRRKFVQKYFKATELSFMHFPITGVLKGNRGIFNMFIMKHAS